ncbi:hypothetical protein P4C99_02480 [Pontiellaceae bacterium B1224]|nr:hypothetical protein [Pontiellaceae bacterium B1224]
MSEKKLADLGLAEFVAGLISETFEAVSSSLEDQIRRHSDLEMAADLNISEFSEMYITSDQVEEAAFQLFGSEENENPAQKGSAYLPPTNNQMELPAFFKALGVELKEEVHFTKSGRTFMLTEDGSDLVFDGIRERLAVEQQTVLQNMLNSGIPKIVVDRGKIVSKVTFDLTEEEEEVQPPTPTVVRPAVSMARLPQIEAFNTSKLALLNRLGTNRSSLILPGVKFKVKQADSTSVSSSTTSILGEVEIEFRTVI